MIYQTNSTTVELSMTPIEIHILFILVILFFLCIGIVQLCSYLSNKIHNSYHRGYNKAKSDKVQYYKVIKKLIDSFDNIYKLMKSDNPELSVNTIELFLDFKKALDNYYKD